jgi:hypothetical protein
VPPNQGAGERNIAQHDVTCQEKLLIALDKHFLTTRARLASTTSCNAKRANEMLCARKRRILKSQNQIADQLVTTGVQIGDAKPRKRNQTSPESKSVAAFGCA